MRLLFMGTPEFAVPCLARLIADGHEITGVFTQPDKPKGRGHKLAPPPVKELALQHNLTVYQPEKLRDGKALEIFHALKPDLAVVVAYGRILPKGLLEVPPSGCVNVHGSLLPKYRGAAPIQWSVLNGDPVGGITTMYMAEGLDSGDMILQEKTPIGENETSGELYERLSQMGASLLSETLKQIASGIAPRIPQEESQATLAPMLEKPMGQLDFSKPAFAVHKWICGMNPWPAAFTALDGMPVKVYRSRIAQGEGDPGTILPGKGLTVACGQGAVELLEIQAQGGKRMVAADYLRGHPLQTPKAGI